MEKMEVTEITTGILEMLGRIENLLAANQFPPVEGETLLIHMTDLIQSLLSEYCFDLVCPLVFFRINERGDHDYHVRFCSESDSFFWSLLKVTTGENDIIGMPRNG